jgi:ribonuclease D
VAIHLHIGDIPAGLDLGSLIAIDTETMGLNPWRDRLCLVQLSSGDGDAHLVKLASDFSAPNLKAQLADPKRVKLFHFARFDLMMMRRWLDIDCQPVICTKIASRLCRTNTDKHGLKDLCKDLLGIELSKQQQSSDWGDAELNQEQLTYAAADVLYLHALWEKLDKMLRREGRRDLAQACYDFLPHRAALDLAGWAEEDIFAH